MAENHVGARAFLVLFFFLVQMFKWSDIQSRRLLNPNVVES